MLLHILDENRQIIDVIRSYESCLWTRKYYDVGGCVLVLAPTTELVNMFIHEAKYIAREDDTMICEIKKMNISLDNTNNTYKMTITALGSETLLNQRIVWNQTNITDTAEMFMRKLVLDNIINPGLIARRIDFVVLGAIKGYTDTLTKQVTYDELLPVIIEVCKTYDMGFRLVRLSNNNLAFEVYRGVDRSQSQTENSYVTFSRLYNNLESFDWEVDFSAYKNVALVGGEGEGTARKRAVVGDTSGIERFETFVDSQSVSSENGTITNSEYNEMLIEAGKNDLATKVATQTFAAKVDVSQYEYKVDFDLGDKVTIEGEFGLSFDAKIIEVIECDDNSGYRVTVNLEI